MPPRRRVALVGLGSMGQRHARVLASMPERFELVGAYDVDPAVRAPEGLVVARTEAEAVAGAELVVIATPMGDHAASVGRSLAAGRHVLVEKPLCSSSGEAWSLVRRARAEARLFVGHSERFNPVVRALAHLLRHDAALSIELARVGPATGCKAGVLMNLGVHDLDLAAYLGRGEVRLRAEGARPADRDDGSAHVTFRTTGGVTGSIHVDGTARAWRRAVRLTTARWVYEGDLMSHRLGRTARATGQRQDIPVTREEPLAAQARALADALDAGPAARPREIALGVDGACAVALAELASAPWAKAAENLSVSGGP